VRALLAALFVAAVAGCGGGDGNDRLTKDELVQKADAVCADYERKVQALGEPQTLPDLATYARAARAALAHGLDELRELEPPAELETKYETWVNTGERTLERIDELETAAAKGNQIEIRRLIDASSREDEESDRLATELGMSECAND
jgi:hypothetical protein